MQIGNVWRAERPQKGRYRQFAQCDIDVIGTSETIYIMNIFSAILDALSQIKIDDIKIIINDRKIIDDILIQCSISDDKKAVF